VSCRGASLSGNPEPAPFTRDSKPASRVLWYEVLGFCAIIAISWADELYNLPELLFGAVSRPNTQEAVLETLVVVAVAIPVLVLTRLVLLRLHYLEGFLRVCAWCKKVDHDGHWVVIEEFFLQGFNTKTSHGICPTCLADAEKRV
jgi:hypothetical protein